VAAIFTSLNDPKLIKLLKQGAVGVLPTDTVYGLVCRADDIKAVARLYKLKNRENKPGTIVASSLDQLTSLGIKRNYLKAVEQFWPGPVSIVVPFSDPNSKHLRLNLPDIAVRIPADKPFVALLYKVGPLLTSSANATSKLPANTIQEAEVYFEGGVDFYVDGGSLKDRQSSTVIRIVDDAVEVLREGAVKIKNNGVVK